MPEQFTSLYKLHQEVDSELILEDEFHIDKERMINLEQNVLLKRDVLHMVVLEYNVFTDAFHCILSPIHLMFYLINLTESSFANHLLDFEVC